MAGTTPNYSIPYAQSADLVSAYPALDQSGMTIIDTTLASKTTTALPINAQTGTTYSFVIGDAGKTVTANNASASTYNIPLEASVAWVTATELRLYNIGAGVVTVTCTSGTLAGTVTIPQYGFVTFKKTGTNTWYGIAQDKAVPSGGISLITSSSFSAASSVSVNNCFTSTYDTYSIRFWLSNGSGADMLIRMRLAGTDATGGNYNFVNVFGTGTTAVSAYGASGTSNVFTYVRAGAQSAGNIEMFRPAIAATTSFTCASDDGQGTAARLFTGAHLVSTAYDGFTIYPSAGNITGTLYVYGYKNS